MQPYLSLYTQGLANLSYHSGERKEGVDFVGEAF